VSDFPEVESAARIFPFANEQMVRSTQTDIAFLDDAVYFVDSSFFDVLSFPIIQGDANRALAQPRTVVLTESTARRIFGTADPVGESIAMGDTTLFEVTAIVADPPENSHIQFNILRTLTDLPFAQAQQWVSNNFFTYIRLQPGTSAESLEEQLPEFFAGYAGPQIAQAFGKPYEEVMTGENSLNYSLEPITDVHLKTSYEIDLQPSGDIQYVRLFIAIALFILALACINFMNLSTAQSASRAMEVGIRKVVGSARGQLILQFLSESTVMAFMAMGIAVGLVFLTTPVFNSITDQSLSAAVLLSPGILVGLVVGSLLVGLLAGSYPAMFLSSFQPVAVIKSQSSSGKSKTLLRNILVVFQFGISIALLVGTFVVGDQLEFIQKRRLGFDKEHTIVIERATQLQTQAEAFKDQIRSFAGVVAVGSGSSLPGEIHGGTAYQPEGNTAEDIVLMAPIFIDYDFIDAMGIELADGRNFSRDFPSDSSAFIVNEAGLEAMEWDEGVGKQLGSFFGQQGSERNWGPIVGVIKDYHYASLRQKIGPVAFTLVQRQMPYIVVRIEGDNPSRVVDYIQTQWTDFVPDQPLQYSFLDDNFDALFAADRRLGRLFSSFAVFAVFIAGLGLFGLGLYVTEQRTKEIGVRKVMGASVPQIVVLLSQDFTKLVLIAIVLATPAAYFGMNRWLEEFVYRTDIQFLSFIFAGVMAIVIAWLTVSYQSIKAAVSDPVDALRYE